jgi:hypothetical protein
MGGKTTDSGAVRPHPETASGSATLTHDISYTKSARLLAAEVPILRISHRLESPLIRGVGGLALKIREGFSGLG